jgi:hypothetical protein
MKQPPSSLWLAATLVGVGTAFWLYATEPRKPWPKPTPPPPASPVFVPSKEHAPSVEEIEQAARSHYQQLELAIERSLVAKDRSSARRHSRSCCPNYSRSSRNVSSPGGEAGAREVRDLLRDEVARVWFRRTSVRPSTG